MIPAPDPDRELQRATYLAPVTLDIQVRRVAILGALPGQASEEETREAYGRDPTLIPLWPTLHAEPETSIQFVQWRGAWVPIRTVGDLKAARCAPERFYREKGGVPEWPLSP